MIDNPDRMSMRNLLKSLQSQLAQRRLVFTSEGEILSLDASSGEVTARDAAVATKGEELMDWERVQVNGRLVPLTCPIRNGDRVDVITRSSSSSSFPAPITPTPMADAIRASSSSSSSRRQPYSWTRPLKFKEVSSSSSSNNDSSRGWWGLPLQW